MSETNGSDLGVTELPTGTVTLLLADVEGSTRLWQTRPEQMTAAIARLDQVLADAVVAHHGVRPVEQGEGDSFVIAFTRAADAVACALALQHAPLAPLALRIGVHTGDIQLRSQAPGDANYIGPTINRTARLRDLAHGGQTVLSGITADLVADHLPDHSWLADLGSHPLRDLPRPERVLQLCHPDLPNDFPPLRTPTAAGTHHLPVQLTSFVGRTIQLGQVGELLIDNRLVTLTGAGGAGKTRLAVEVAAHWTDQAPDGVWYVDLAPITHPEVVPVAAARALELPDQPGRSMMDTLTRFIGDRRLLMVLDNCEHLLDASAALAGDLLGACPRLRLLTTSREPIGIPGEVTFVVPSLSLADEAIELFADRARRAQPEFVVADANSATVAQICERLDGMPLAIELAASRVRALTLDEILAGLRDRFRLLTGGARRAVRRQQTLHASVDWSHALLTDAERTLFRRLAVFLGGFDLDAALAVAAEPGMQRYQVLDLLSLLVDKSLVVVDNSGGRTRYRLLETVRQYGLEKLADAGETDAVGGRHRDHYTALAADLDAPKDAGNAQRLAQAEIEIDNLRSAFAWSLENADTGSALRLAASLQSLWFTRWRIREGLAWLDAALAADSGTDSDPARVRALVDKGLLLSFSGSVEGARTADHALGMAREVGDPALLIRALAAHGYAYAYDFEVAGAHFLEASGLARELGDRWRLSQILTAQAVAATSVGDHVAMTAAAGEGGVLAEEIGDEFNARQCRLALANAHMHRGELPQSVAKLREVAAEATAAHDPFCRAAALLSEAFGCAYLGDVDGAQLATDALLSDRSNVGELIDRSGYVAIATIRLAAGDAAAANSAFESALQRTPLTPATVSVYVFAALAPLASGDLTTARRLADDVVALAKSTSLVAALTARARVEIARGEIEEARQDAHHALDEAAESHGYVAVADAFECLAYLAGDAGSHRESARLFGAADAARRHTGAARFKTLDADHERRLAAVREELGDSDFHATLAEGAGLSIAEAIGYAQRGRGERKRPASGWASLTPAEREVVRLAADGLGNPDIAARLFISPRTVQTHLSHVYTKLGLTSRVQLMKEAARRGC